jgi:Pyruvate/2-oxoacid:ferredoxin oxidoreductase delta subunit
MSLCAAHHALADKFLFRGSYPQVPVSEALLALMEFAFSEEEARILTALSFTPLPARVIARRLKMPVGLVRPILDSLADRLFIARMKVGKISLYNFMLLIPGIFELQMLRSKNPGADMAWFTRFAELFSRAYENFVAWGEPKTRGKDMRFGRIIPVEKSLESVSGIMPLATDRFSEFVDRSKSFCLANVCACRQEKTLLGEGCGRGMEVCGGMGLLADFAVAKGLARRVDRQEFMEAKQRAAELGLVNMVDNLLDPLQVCSCCTCCCAGLRVIKQYNIPTLIARSHFLPEIDESLCIGCGKCAKVCPMEALSLGPDKKMQIDHTRCFGCGLCVLKCEKQKAINLVERDGHKGPAPDVTTYFSERVREMQEKEHSPLTGLGLDAARFLINKAGLGISGPNQRDLTRFFED